MGTLRSGMSEARLERIRPALERHVGEEKLCGTVALVHRRGETVYADALGLLSRESGRPMPQDAIFRIFSMTKPITCVALMLLHEEGRFRLQDPVSRYIPAFAGLQVYPGDPLAREVTVHDLLLHTSGLTYHFRESGEVEALYREARVFSDQPLERFVDELTRLPLAFQPGTEWRYSVSQDVAAHLVEILSGQPFDEFLSARLFEPLGMEDTGFHVPAQKLERFASMYGVADVVAPDAIGPRLTAEAETGVNRLIAGPEDSLESAPHGVLRGGHGLVSTAEDYLRFCRMLIGGGEIEGIRLLGRKTVELITANHIDAALLPICYEDGPIPGVGYGLGFGVVMDVGLSGAAGSVGAYHWSGAATTSFWVDPAEDLIGVQMAQFQPSGFHLVAEDFQTLVYQAILD